MTNRMPLKTALDEDDPEALRDCLDDSPDYLSLQDLDATVLRTLTDLSPDCMDVLFGCERIPDHLKEIWVGNLTHSVDELSDEQIEHAIGQNWWGYPAENIEGISDLVLEGKFDLIERWFQKRGPISNIPFQTDDEQQRILYEHYAGDYSEQKDAIAFFIDMAFQHLNPHALRYAFEISSDNIAYDYTIDMLQGRDAFVVIATEGAAHSNPGEFFRVLDDHVSFQGDELLTMLQEIDTERPEVFLAALRVFREEGRANLIDDEADDFLDKVNDESVQNHGPIVAELYEQGATPQKPREAVRDLLNDDNPEAWARLFEHIDYPEGDVHDLYERTELVFKCVKQPDYAHVFGGQAGLDQDQRLKLVEAILDELVKRGDALFEDNASRYRITGLIHAISALSQSDRQTLFGEFFDRVTQKSPEAYEFLALKALIKGGAVPEQKQADWLFRQAFARTGYRLGHELLEQGHQPSVDVLKEAEVDEPMQELLEDKLSGRALKFLRQADNEVLA